MTLERYANADERAKYPTCNYKNCTEKSDNKNLQRQTFVSNMRIAIFSSQDSANAERACSHDCRRSCLQTRYSLSIVGSAASVSSTTSNKTRSGDDDDDDVGDATSKQAPNLTKMRLSWGSFEFLQVSQRIKVIIFMNRKRCNKQKTTSFQLEQQYKWVMAIYLHII